MKLGAALFEAVSPVRYKTVQVVLPGSPTSELEESPNQGSTNAGSGRVREGSITPPCRELPGLDHVAPHLGIWP